MKELLILPVFIIAFISLLSPVFSIDLTTCKTSGWSSGNTYNLLNNVSGTVYCFIVDANDIVINLNGNWVNITDLSANSYAVMMPDNVTLKNGFLGGSQDVSASQTGIYCYNNNYIQNINIVGFGANGNGIVFYGNNNIAKDINISKGVGGYDIVVVGSDNYGCSLNYTTFIDYSVNNVFTTASCIVTQQQSCFNITEDDNTTVLQKDIVLNFDDTGANPDYCIKINATNVTLDLNGHYVRTGTINGYGIISGILTQNADNIIIRNGIIQGFDEGITHSGDNSTFRNLKITTGQHAGVATPKAIDFQLGVNNRVYDCDLTGSIGIYTVNNQEDSNNVFSRIKIYSGKYGIYGQNIRYANFTQINIYNTVTNNSFTQGNTYCFEYGFLGSQTCIITPNTNVPLTVTKVDGNGLYCKNCTNIVLAGSIIGTFDNPVYIEGTDNSIFGNIDTYTETGKGFFLDGTSDDNIICNYNGQIFDFGTGNTQDARCPTYIPFGQLVGCNFGYSCIGTTSYFFDINCNVVNQTVCSGTTSCNSLTGVCTGNIMPNGTSTEPYPDLNSGITQFINIFSAPIFIWTIVLGIIAGASEYYIRTGGKVFGIIFIIGLTLLAIFGIYPWWFLVVEGIIVAGIIGILIRKGQG